MTNPHRLFGSEMSPYSVKVRSYFRYKEIPHRWILRNAHSQDEFQKHARLPLIPLVVTPEGEGIQDSTPILERFEVEVPEPAIQPGESVAAFLSELLEEFGDEWGNKWMFHYRWSRELDRASAAGRIARQMVPEADDAQFETIAAQIRERMVDRVGFVGSSQGTGPIIEASFLDTIELLEVHLRDRRYLMGERPAFADFGLWPQLYTAWTDPTPGAFIEGRAPSLLAWIHRMLWPRAEGDFESWESLAPTLGPLFERQVGRLFVPWTLANARAIAAGSEEMVAEVDGHEWRQRPQKYHAKSLAVLREKYAAVSDRARLDAVLGDLGCLDLFGE